MQFVAGICRDVTRNNVMWKRDLGIQTAVCHRNLERCNTKYDNVSQEFKSTESSLSQEFGDLIRNTVTSLRNLWIQNAVCHRNLENCNAKYDNVSEEFTNTKCSFSKKFREQEYEIRYCDRGIKEYRMYFVTGI
jgi:intracellular sulfur oxidation DsrE/DsrF family protein